MMPKGAKRCPNELQLVPNEWQNDRTNVPNGRIPRGSQTPKQLDKNQHLRLKVSCGCDPWIAKMGQYAKMEPPGLQNYMLECNK